MIKATDLIKKETVFIGNGHKFDNIRAVCSETAITLYKAKLFAAKDPHEAVMIIGKYRKLAARFEREFLRATNKSKFIILYGSDDLEVVDIYMLPINIGIPEKPEDIVYGNAVFNSREEAEEIAIAQCLDYYIIVEVSNES